MMSDDPQKVPTPGYRILDVRAVYQRYELKDPEVEGLEDSTGFQLVWDWRVSGPGRFEVFLGVLVSASTSRPEEIDVRVVGDFAVVGPTQSLAIEPFAHTSAPAILMPYLREKVTRLTSDGPLGTYWLPLINIHALMEQYDYAASRGAQQLADDPRALDQGDSAPASEAGDEAGDG